MYIGRYFLKQRKYLFVYDLTTATAFFNIYPVDKIRVCFYNINNTDRKNKF